MSRYTVYVTPAALKEIKQLPGHVKQSVIRLIRELADQPRPAQSRALDWPVAQYELRRFRLEKWRIVYSVVEQERLVDILAVRKRPPYDYGDLELLLKGIE